MTVNSPTRNGDVGSPRRSSFSPATSTSVSAQSLGDVARREAERRQQVTSGKVYTNGDLAPVDPASTPPPQAPVERVGATGGESPARSSQPPGSSTGKEPGQGVHHVKGREKRDEHYWRTLIRGLRARVEKAKGEVAAQEARLAEIDGGPADPRQGCANGRSLRTTISRAPARCAIPERGADTLPDSRAECQGSRRMDHGNAQASGNVISILAPPLADCPATTRPLWVTTTF